MKILDTSKLFIFAGRNENEESPSNMVKLLACLEVARQSWIFTTGVWLIIKVVYANLCMAGIIVDPPFEVPFQ